MKKLLLLVLVFPIPLLSACQKSYRGTSSLNFEHFPENKVSAKKAIRLATPYLDKSYKLRSDMVTRTPDMEPTVFVTLTGKYYHIVKENFPSKNLNFYLPHAVKVDKDTGEVIAPK